MGKLRSNVLYNLYTSTNIIKMIKSWMVKWEGYVE